MGGPICQPQPRPFAPLPLWMWSWALKSRSESSVLSGLWHGDGVLERPSGARVRCSWHPHAFERDAPQLRRCAFPGNDAHASPDARPCLPEPLRGEPLGRSSPVSRAHDGFHASWIPLLRPNRLELRRLAARHAFSLAECDGVLPSYGVHDASSTLRWTQNLSPKQRDFWSKH